MRSIVPASRTTWRPWTRRITGRWAPQTGSPDPTTRRATSRPTDPPTAAGSGSPEKTMTPRRGRSPRCSPARLQRAGDRSSPAPRPPSHAPRRSRTPRRRRQQCRRHDRRVALLARDLPAGCGAGDRGPGDHRFRALRDREARSPDLPPHARDRRRDARSHALRRRQWADRRQGLPAVGMVPIHVDPLALCGRPRSIGISNRCPR